MLWKLFQGAIFVAVYGSLINLADESGHPLFSGHAPALLGFLAAYFATLLVNGVLKLARRQVSSPSTA